MEDSFRPAQINNQVPDFGNVRITYQRIDNDQLMYVDELPVYALAIGTGEPLSEAALYRAYLQSLIDITEQAQRLCQEP